MTSDEFNALVVRLRSNAANHVVEEGDYLKAADAITELRSERDALKATLEQIDEEREAALCALAETVIEARGLRAEVVRANSRVLELGRTLARQGAF